MSNPPRRRDSHHRLKRMTFVEKVIRARRRQLNRHLRRTQPFWNMARHIDEAS
jgi:hypothetical protein